jgi:hypothetical protein
MRYGGETVNDEEGRLWMELIVTYFKMLFPHLLVWIGESDEKGVRTVGP